MNEKGKYTNTYNLNKRIVFVIPILCFFILLTAAYHSLKNPEYNWDMLPYMALTLKIDNADTKTAHDLTYQTVKENLPSSTYQNLATVNPYRKKMSEDAVAFNNQLPFYVVKPLYVGLVYIFFKSGVPLAESTILPSVLAFILCAILLYHWLTKYIGVLFASGLSLFVMLSPPILSMSKLSTPDAISAFFLFTAIYFMIENPKKKPLLLFLLLSIFTRLDNILTCTIILSLLAFSNKSALKISFKEYTLYLLILAVSYFIITFSATKYGWSIFYFNSFLHRASSSHDSNFSLKDYVHLMYSNGVNGFFYSHISIFLSLLLAVFIDAETISQKSLNFDKQFSLIILLIVLVKFILHPDIDDRYYVVFYLVSLVFLIRKLINHKSLSNQNDSA